jgi:hypothetical protein
MAAAAEAAASTGAAMSRSLRHGRSGRGWVGRSSKKIKLSLGERGLRENKKLSKQKMSGAAEILNAES